MKAGEREGGYRRKANRYVKRYYPALLKNRKAISIGRHSFPLRWRGGHKECCLVFNIMKRVSAHLATLSTSGGSWIRAQFSAIVHKMHRKMVYKYILVYACINNIPHHMCVYVPAGVRARDPVCAYECAFACV